MQMKNPALLLLLLLDSSSLVPTLTWTPGENNDDVENATETLVHFDDTVVPRIQEFFWHMRASKPGLPGFPIPDVMEIPNMSTEVKGLMLTFENSSVTGLSQFFLESIEMDLVNLEVKMNSTLPRLLIEGNYTMVGKMALMSFNNSDKFWLELSNASIFGHANLSATEEGQLEMSDITLDIQVQKIRLNFENLLVKGFMSRMFNAMLNALSNILFEYSKPALLSRTQITIQEMANAWFGAMPPEPMLLTALIPLDTVLERTAEEMERRQFDPYALPTHEHTFEKDVLLFKVRGDARLFDGYMKGLSTLHRHGNVTASFANNTFSLLAHVGFDTLEGGYKWSVKFMGVEKSGGVHFRIDSLQLRVKFSLENEKDRHPTIDILEIEGLHQIKNDVDGLGSFDLILEFLLNFVSNVFKHHLTNVIQGPIQNIIQENLKPIKLPF